MVSGRKMKKMIQQSHFVYSGNKMDGTHLGFYKAFHLLAYDMLIKKYNQHGTYWIN